MHSFCIIGNKVNTQILRTLWLKQHIISISSRKKWPHTVGLPVLAECVNYSSGLTQETTDRQSISAFF